MGNVSTPQHNDLELVGHFGGVTRRILVREPYLYVHFGPELAVLDISTLQQPKRVGYLVLEGTIQDIYIVGAYAYVTVYFDIAVEGGLYIIDVSDPTNLKKVSFFSTTPLSPSSVIVANGHAYLAARGHDKLVVVNISDPAQPKRVTAYPSIQLGQPIGVYWWFVPVTGHYVYFDTVGLHIIDPAGLQKLDGYKFQEMFGHTSVDNHHAYAATAEGFLIYDVSNPSPLTHVGIYETDFYVADLTVFEGYVFIIGDNEEGTGSLHVVDVSVPTHPKSIAQIDSPGSCVTVSGDYAYVKFNYGGLRIIDVTHSTRPVEIGSYLVPPFVDYVALTNRLACIAAGDGGLYIADFSDPKMPIGIGFYTSSRVASNVTFVGTYAYLLEGPERADAIAHDGYGAALRIVDISRPEKPIPVGFLELPDEATEDIVVIGDMAYILLGWLDYNTAKWSLRMIEVDISNPVSPRQIASHTLAPESPHIEISGNEFYIIERNCSDTP